MAVNTMVQAHEETGAAPDGGGAKQGVIRRIFKVRETGVLLALLILFVFFSLANKYFLGVTNLLNVVRQVSLLGIIALGMTMVITCAEIDLSVGAVYGLASTIAGMMMTKGGLPIWLALLLTLIVCVAVGAFNGILVTWGRIPALIVTLGMMNIARGGALILSQAQVIGINYRTVADKGVNNFLYIGQGKLFDTVPMLALFFAVLAIFAYLMFNRTIFGFHMRAVGGNPVAARAAGLNSARVKIIAFSVLGLLCGITGILNLSFLGNVQGTVGVGLELDVIAATIIGGTSLAGGSGTIIGTIIGVLIMGVLRNGIMLMGISPFWQVALIGVVVIGAVAVDVWTTARKRA
ncbi:MAG: ABC transporter permease [Spirochaetia bacterium]|jgi:ribose/xylose/arabinose/galactoside ABC-type transport system permease subunit